MSSGFPNVPNRAGFGPEMVNKREPVIAETDLSADQVNLTFWQAAGAGRVLPQIVILFNGATPAILFQGLAFDPNQELDNITFVKNGTGDYTFTFSSTYNDQNGNPTSFVPRMSTAMLQSVGNNVFVTTHLPVGQTIQVEVQTDADVLQDETFMLTVW